MVTVAELTGSGQPQASRHGLGQAEIEDLHAAVRGQFDVGWLEIAVNDAFLVRGFESFADLARDVERFVERDRSLGDTFGESDALDQLHHECAFFDPVDPRDVRMIERRQHLGLALEPRHAIGVLGENVRQDFDRYLAPQLSVGSPPHFAHAAFAQLGGDPVMSDGMLRAHGGDSRHRITFGPDDAPHGS